MTDTRFSTPVDRDHSSAADIAPWYLNETLSDDDRAWFESTLAEDPRGADALAFDRRIAAALQHRAEEIPADIGWNRLLQRMRTESAAQSASSTDRVRSVAAPALANGGAGNTFGERIQGWLSSFWSPNVGAAMAAVLIAQTAAIGYLVSEPGDSVSYRSVADVKPEPVIRALFVESITEAQLRAALLESGLNIVSGPDSVGQYLLIGESDADLAEAATRLRAAGVVNSVALDQRPVAR